MLSRQPNWDKFVDYNVSRTTFRDDPVDTLPMPFLLVRLSGFTGMPACSHLRAQDKENSFDPITSMDCTFPKTNQ